MVAGVLVEDVLMWLWVCFCRVCFLYCGCNCLSVVVAMVLSCGRKTG